MRNAGKLLLMLLVSSCAILLKTRKEYTPSSELEVIVKDVDISYDDSVFQIASYNVENLFDDREDGTEYNDYSQKHSNYSAKYFFMKISNIKRVVKDMDPEILAIQEVESRRALEVLHDSLKELGFKYSVIADKPQRTAVNVALLSKFPIISARGYYTIKNVRNVLLCKILFGQDTFFVIVNHWKSKSGPESQRIAIAKVVRKIVDSLLSINPNYDIIVLGDFNTHVEEKVSDVVSGDAFYPIAVIGLTHVLKTTGDTSKLKEGYLYNLWYELPEEKWGSHYFAGEWGTLDHILISYGLFDTSGIYYIPQSFQVFKKDYLLDEKGRPYRWQMSRGDYTYHLGKGFSDHLPIYASFSR